MNSKPPLLFGIARSGTTPYHKIIAEYLWKNFGTHNLAEYFQHHKLHYSDTGTEIVMKMEPGYQARTNQEWILLADKKIEWLKKYRDKYFFKILTHHLPTKHLSWLMENFDWIFVERKDIYEHFLSYCVSVSSNLWYQPGGIKIAPRSLRFENHLVDDFGFHYLRYMKMKELYKPNKVLFYEELNDDWSGILENLNLRIPTDLSGVRMTERQNKGPKMDLFENPQDLEEAFEKSFFGRFQR